MSITALGVQKALNAPEQGVGGPRAHSLVHMRSTKTVTAEQTGITQRALVGDVTSSLSARRLALRSVVHRNDVSRNGSTSVRVFGKVAVNPSHQHVSALDSGVRVRDSVIHSTCRVAQHCYKVERREAEEGKS
eukprot:1519168-Rhodomonas_salina.1